MALWFPLALMTAAAVFVVLWPLGRARLAKPAGGDVAVYRDQMRELERDRSAGLIAAAEADAARVEISRRLLAADDAQHHAAPISLAPLPRPFARRRGGAASPGARPCLRCRSARSRFISLSVFPASPISRSPHATTGPTAARSPPWWRTSKIAWNAILRTVAAGR